MLDKVRRAFQLWSNMGTRYVAFRVKYALLSRTGLLKRRFPDTIPETNYPSLSTWQSEAASFFFSSKEDIRIPKMPNVFLEKKAQSIMQGRIVLFSYQEIELGTDYDWLTNPENGYKYDISKHWSEINDFSHQAGDIKFVWEKSRFSHFLPVIRYDYHFEQDCSEWTFAEIDSWIAANPLNYGPNYKCSQEISLRVLNWLFVLYYYRNAPQLTEKRFTAMLKSIHGQIDHVYQNIDFSRIAVRNNHAITETLTLYLVGLLMPFLPGAEKWKKDGKKWLEEEIEYQIYEDGTFIQFSHNYHRVLIQLLTWALHLSDANKESFSDRFYQKSAKTLSYLYQCQVEENGQLPNYGANDGALFFNLSDSEYRDYRPQLNALFHFLTGKTLYENENGEDYLWYNQYHSFKPKSDLSLSRPAVSEFLQGGIYVLRDKNTLTFLKCAVYRDRPSQADNLHIDIWYKGENLLFDAGTYKYNTDERTIKYFFGTEGHNTVMLGSHDQMQKGPRFIWWNWTSEAVASISESEHYFEFNGRIKAFESLGKNIYHSRTVKKYKDQLRWKVEDSFTDIKGQQMRQIWHILPGKEQVIKLNSTSVEERIINSWYSSYYGVKVPALQIEFLELNHPIKTILEIID